MCGGEQVTLEYLLCTNWLALVLLRPHHFRGTDVRAGWVTESLVLKSTWFQPYTHDRDVRLVLPGEYECVLLREPRHPVCVCIGTGTDDMQQHVE
jgi:hypothetical protein